MAFALLMTVAACPIRAHDGPEHEVEELTHRLTSGTPTAELFIQRALEYRILGKLNDAAKDLERALALDRDSSIAQRELSQVYFALGKTNDALATANRALRAVDDPIDRASILMVRASIFRARRDYEEALADASEAITLHPLNAEWYLVRSRLQLRLKQSAQRVDGLADGLRDTGSGLLLGEWADAAIDDGRHAETLPVVERELNDSRWKAAWLIRRARIRMATQQHQAGEEDLREAVRELDQRLGPSTKDALLLADRGLANDLLGRREAARRDYRDALQEGLVDEWIRERARALRGRRSGDDD